MRGVNHLRVGAAAGILNTVWQVGGSLGIGAAQAYFTVRVAVRQSDLAGSALLREFRSTMRLPTT